MFHNQFEKLDDDEETPIPQQEQKKVKTHTKKVKPVDSEPKETEGGQRKVYYKD
jgi:hypothetical protein